MKNELTKFMSRAFARSGQSIIAGAFFSALGLVITTEDSYAGSATWQLDPRNQDWSTAANWTPATVPNGPNDIATFDVSNVTGISISGGLGGLIEVNSIVFNPGASAYTITPGKKHDGGLFIVTGMGIINNSGVIQNFVIDPNADNTLTSINNGTAGILTNFTILSGDPTAHSHRPSDPKSPTLSGLLQIAGTASAGSGTFTTKGSTIGGFGGTLYFTQSASGGNSTVTNEGSAASGEFEGGATTFVDDSTAGEAIFTNKGGLAPDGEGGVTFFAAMSSAGNATFTNEGASVSGAAGGRTQFVDSSNAGAATLIATAGLGGGQAGGIIFLAHSKGGTARVEVFGDGYLDISSLADPAVTIGSLEGDGLVFIGRKGLAVGSNNLSTSFGGVIDDLGGGGSFTKVGTGTLKLSGDNSYTGGTVVEEGSLVVNNRTGSATGPGAVQLNAGTLGGRGTIAGAVTIGTGSSAGAFLAPGQDASQTITLTIQSALTIKADGTYNYRLKTKKAEADEVIANGVTIESGAQFSFKQLGNKKLVIGTVFTAISNTSATPISGAFANLPDDSTFTVGRNTFQADYQGSDGNVLTLTVVL